MLTVSIINFQNCDQTALCLRDLEIAAKGMSCRVFIRDNSPISETEKLAALAEESSLDVQLFYSPDNPGFGSGHNLNFQASAHNPGDQFLVLNNDVRIPDAQVLTAMKVQCQPGTLVSCTITKADGKGWFCGGYISGITGDVLVSREPFLPDYRECAFLTGCCLIIDAADFERLGGFDGRFFMYAEDLDLSLRAQLRGMRLRVVRESIVHMIGSGERGQYSDLYIYENTKNRLICLRRFRMGLPVVRTAYFFFKYGLVRFGQLAILSAAPMRQIGQLLRGLRDGALHRVSAE